MSNYLGIRPFVLALFSCMERLIFCKSIKNAEETVRMIMFFRLLEIHPSQSAKDLLHHFVVLPLMALAVAFL